MVVLPVRMSDQRVRQTGRLAHVLTPGDHRDEPSRLGTAEPQTTAGRIVLIISTTSDVLMLFVYTLRVPIQ